MSNDTSGGPAPRSRTPLALATTPLALATTAVALALAAVALPLGQSPSREAASDEAVSAFIASVTPAAFACDARLTSTETDTGERRMAEPLAPGLERLRAAVYTSERLDRPSGSGVRTACRDAQFPYRVTWHFELRQLERVRTLDGTVTLNAFESRHTVEAPRDARLVDDTVVAETVSLPDIDAWLPAPDGDGLVAALSARRAGAGTRGCGGPATGRCTADLDIGWRLRAVGGAVSIEQTFWVGGRAAERVTWRLEA